MRRLAPWLAMVLLLALGPATAAPGQQGTPAEAVPSAGAVPAAAVAAARDAVYPALVNLTVVSRSFEGGRTVRIPGNGSGVIVTPEGHVLTNYHVAGDALRITATLTGGDVVDAEVVAHDALTDLSVLRLVPEEAGRTFPHAALGDSDALAVGDPVLAMGNPLALSSSVSLGIVANPQRVFTDFANSRLQEMDLITGERTGLFTRWIQHDALILPGNSGGPLVDLGGRVVGINELGGSGLGFAIPANVASRVLGQVLERGRVVRGWLGFQVLPVSRLGRDDGALVSAVLPGSPADRAGLRPGDLLVELDGEPVSVRFFEQVPPLYARVAELRPGARVPARVLRSAAGTGAVAEAHEAEEVEVTFEVGEREPAVGEEEEIPALGVTVQAITAPMALERTLPDASGLLVTGVRAGSPLEEARPAPTPGSVLLTFAGRAVASPAELAGVVAEAWPGEGGDEAPLAVTFRRGREELVTLVRRGEERRRRHGGELPAAWLGARTQVVTADVADALGLPEPGGFRVTEVLAWGGAGRSGLAVGDVIRGFAGAPMDAARPEAREELRRAVERRSPGERVTLDVVRPRPGEEAERLEIAVTLEERPREPSVADRYRQEELEVAVREITVSDRLEHGWDADTAGVVVVEVEPGSWAQMAGLLLGDLVQEVAGEPVAGVDSFAAAIERALAERAEVIPLFLRRGGRTHFVFIEPDWSAAGSSPSRPAGASG